VNRLIKRIYPDGSFVVEPDTSGMLSPVRHNTCGHVFDEAAAERIARYADCDIYRCPGCRGQCDNRPVGWGGNVTRLTGDFG
jgi:hypothetical protein